MVKTTLNVYEQHKVPHSAIRQRQHLNIIENAGLTLLTGEEVFEADTKEQFVAVYREEGKTLWLRKKDYLIVQKKYGTHAKNISDLFNAEFERIRKSKHGREIKLQYNRERKKMKNAPLEEKLELILDIEDEVLYKHVEIKRQREEIRKTHRKEVIRRKANKKVSKKTIKKYIPKPKKKVRTKIQKPKKIISIKREKPKIEKSMIKEGFGTKIAAMITNIITMLKK